MSTEYTPTTGNIQDAYCHVQQEVLDEHGDSAHERFHAEFDRWLAGVKAEALERAAEIADEYAVEAREMRDNGTDYPDSRYGMQVHGFMHGGQDVAIRIRAEAARLREEAAK